MGVAPILSRRSGAIGQQRGRAVESGAAPWHRRGSRSPNDGGYPTMQIVLEIPDELKAVGEAVAAMVTQIEAAWRSTEGSQAVAYAEIEAQLAAGAAAIERAGHQAVWQGLEVDQPRVRIDGQVYA